MDVSCILNLYLWKALTSMSEIFIVPVNDGNEGVPWSLAKGIWFGLGN